MSTHIIIFFLMAAFGIRSTTAADEFAQVQYAVTPLSQQLYMLEGGGGNITALIGSDGVFLVDDDFAEMAEKLVATLNDLKGGSPRYIVNTHFHYDHTGGNKIFGSSATIIAAKEVRDRLMTEQQLWKKSHPAEPPQAWPHLISDKELSLFINGEEIKIQHLPHGHTDGDTVVYFKTSKVVSMGDLYFSGMYPIFHPEHKGSLEGYLQNVSLVLSTIDDEYKIVPGHGPMTSKIELQKYHDMIRASIDIVRLGLRQRLSLEQIQKRGLPPQWESFSHGYLGTDSWLALVYAELKNQR